MDALCNEEEEEEEEEVWSWECSRSSEDIKRTQRCRKCEASEVAICDVIVKAHHRHLLYVSAHGSFTSVSIILTFHFSLFYFNCFLYY